MLTRRQSRRAVWLRTRNGEEQVRLLQRPEDASLMAGMWELPDYAPADDEAPEFTVRHAITVTQHVVDIHVVRSSQPPAEGMWISVAELDRYPLTGLTRKVLRRVGCLA